VFVNVSMPHKIAYYPEKQEYQLQTGKGLQIFFEEWHQGARIVGLLSVGVTDGQGTQLLRCGI